MKSGQGCAKVALYGFALTFCAAGVGILYGAYSNIESGDSQTAILMLLAGLAFGGAGVAVLLLARSGFRTQKREEALQAAHPNEPWNWKEDWASGRIRSSGASMAKGLWGFAILWNLISAPLCFFLPDEIINKGNYGALLGLLFPLVGIGLLIAAVRKTMQARRYGECLFVMERVPGILGGEVAGTLLVPRGLPSGQALSVKLSCIREVKVRTGKSTSTNEHPEWETESLTVLLSPTGDGAAQNARLRFRVPYDSKPTAQVSENTRVFWRLEASADVPGVDFTATFEVPVFQTELSSPKLTEEELRSEEVKTEIPAVTFADPEAVTVGPSAGGGTEFVLHPNKDGPGILASFVTAIVFGGVGALLWYAGAPFVFPLFFGGIGLLIVLFIIFGAFGESRIVIEDGHVSVRNVLFGIMHGRRALCSSITKISVNGEGSTKKRGHYSIALTRNDGKNLSPLQYLRDKHQADWLAEEVRKAMEPWRKSEQKLVGSR